MNKNIPVPVKALTKEQLIKQVEYLTRRLSEEKHKGVIVQQNAAKREQEAVEAAKQLNAVCDALLYALVKKFGSFTIDKIHVDNPKSVKVVPTEDGKQLNISLAE